MGARKSVSITVLPGSTVDLINKELVNKLVTKFTPDIVNKTDEENTDTNLFKFNKKIRLIVEYRGDENIPSKRVVKTGSKNSDDKPKTSVAKDKVVALTENTEFNLDILAKVRGEIKDESASENQVDQEILESNGPVNEHSSEKEEEQLEDVQG